MIAELEPLVIRDHLASQGVALQAHRLGGLLEERASEGLIGRGVQKLREQFFSSGPFQRELDEVCRTEAALQRVISELRSDPAMVDFYGEIRSTSGVLTRGGGENLKLYHWCTREALPLIQEIGILPGFCTGQTTRQHVYASLYPNQFWATESISEDVHKSLAYSRNGFRSTEFVQLEIDYDPTLEAYMWLPFQYQRERGPVAEISTMYKSKLLSSICMPLAEQVDVLTLHDRKFLDAVEAGLINSVDLYDEPWQYSPLLGCKAPYCTLTHPSSWESSEVLLDYVAPERITAFHPSGGNDRSSG
jgi:hypothetical protein